MINGSDLDGTLCVNSLDKSLYRPYKLHEFYSRCTPAPLSRVHWNMIITGRRIHYFNVTKLWLHKNNVSHDCLLMFPNKKPKNNRSLAKFKSMEIIRWGVDVYFEDDKRIADYLSKNCPNTEIKFVKNKY